MGPVRSGLRPRESHGDAMEEAVSREVVSWALGGGLHLVA